MLRGLEIAFQLNNSGETDVVQALGDLTGNYFKKNKDPNLDWRIFHVTLGDNKYFRVLYKNERDTILGHGLKAKIKQKFDDLSHMSYDSLIELYKNESSREDFEKKPIKELTEEYDLWQDKLWYYI